MTKYSLSTAEPMASYVTCTYTGTTTSLLHGSQYLACSTAEFPQPPQSFFFSLKRHAGTACHAVTQGSRSLLVPAIRRQHGMPKHNVGCTACPPTSGFPGLAVLDADSLACRSKMTMALNSSRQTRFMLLSHGRRPVVWRCTSPGR